MVGYSQTIYGGLLPHLGEREGSYREIWQIRFIQFTADYQICAKGKDSTAKYGGLEDEIYALVGMDYYQIWAQ